MTGDDWEARERSWRGRTALYRRYEDRIMGEVLGDRSERRMREAHLIHALKAELDGRLVSDVEMEAP